MKANLSILRGAVPALLFVLSVSAYGFEMGSTANAVNNFGGIVGARYSVDNTIVPRATLWIRDILVFDLGTLPHGTLSEALAVNNFGQVVGYSTAADGSTHAFLWHFGVMRDLGTLGPDYRYSRANGINDRGEVVGVSCKQDPYAQSGVILHNPMPPADPSFACRAFLWRRGQMLNLGVYPGGTFSSAQAINNKGQVVGSGDIPAPQDPPELPLDEIRALVWDHGKLTALGPETFCLCEVYGSAINARGSVAGFYVSDGANFALYWIAGVQMAFPRLGGRALQMMITTGIDNRGRIVGVSPFSVPGYDDLRIAFLFQNGKAVPLPTLNPSAPDSGAQGINESGLIVGWDSGKAVMWENGVIKLLK